MELIIKRVLIQLEKMKMEFSLSNALPLLSKMQEMFFHFADFVTLVRIFNRTEDYKIF